MITVLWCVVIMLMYIAVAPGYRFMLVMLNSCRIRSIAVLPHYFQQAYSCLKARGHLQQAAMLALHSESPVLQEDVIGLISDNHQVSSHCIHTLTLTTTSFKF